MVLPEVNLPVRFAMSEKNERFHEWAPDLTEALKVDSILEVS
jgi:hypothetical protein